MQQTIFAPSHGLSVRTPTHLFRDGLRNEQWQSTDMAVHLTNRSKKLLFLFLLKHMFPLGPPNFSRLYLVLPLSTCLGDMLSVPHIGEWVCHNLARLSGVSMWYILQMFGVGHSNIECRYMLTRHNQNINSKLKKFTDMYNDAITTRFTWVFRAVCEEEKPLKWKTTYFW